MKLPVSRFLIAGAIVLTLVILLSIASFQPVATPAAQCADCNAVRRTCMDSADVIEGVCKSQGGSAENCAGAWNDFFNSCMRTNQCDKWWQPSPRGTPNN